jgi:CheY-like chemotaxis protein
MFDASFLNGHEPSSGTGLDVEGELAGLKVLVVDDSPDNQMLIRIILEQADAIVTIAEDGKKALDLIAENPFDIVLMDIQMPVMDGHEATRTLRARHFHLPIIALTAHAMKEERERCIESGFSEFLAKPVRREEMIEMLKSFVVSRPTDVERLSANSAQGKD